MTFEEKFKKLRKQNHWTQQATAEALGINRRMVTLYESGKSYPRTREAYHKVADLFGVDPNYLLTEGDEYMADFGGLTIDEIRDKADEIVKAVGVLFQGTRLTEEEKDNLMQSLQNAYWEGRKKNRGRV